MVVCCTNACTNEPKPVRVLLVTGGHDFDREPFFAMMKSFAGMTYTEVAHPDAWVMFKPENRNVYDVILLYDMPQAIDEQAKNDYMDCLKQGKGLVVLHHAYGAYPDWQEYQTIVGGRYYFTPWVDAKGVTQPASTYQHDVTFTVKVADKKHPVTKGIEDFEILDETYRDGCVNPNVNILLTTNEPTSTPSIAWTNLYGRSRVVTILLGHDQHAWENPNFKTLLTQAVQWVK